MTATQTERGQAARREMKQSSGSQEDQAHLESPSVASRESEPTSTNAGSPLFGRRTDLERLERLLMPTGALVTVVGPPGVGKTRLSTEILARSSCADRFTVLLSEITD